MKLLSICIPTFNRLKTLKLLVNSIYNQENVDWNLVEVVISDNASTDGTDEYLTDIECLTNIKLHRNTTNVGMIGNWKRAINISNGKFIWLVGSDDLLVKDSLSKLLHTLRQNEELDLVFLNNNYYLPSDIIEKELLEYGEIRNPTVRIQDQQVKRVEKVSELASLREDAFTPIYTLIMKKMHWSNSLELYDTTQQTFSSAVNCIPHAFYVANNLFDKPGLYYGIPPLIASHAIGWKEYFPLYFAQYLPDLYETWIKNGVSKNIVNYNKAIAIKNGDHVNSVPYLLCKRSIGYQKFSLIRYIIRFYGITGFKSVVYSIVKHYLRNRS